VYVVVAAVVMGFFLVFFKDDSLDLKSGDDVDGEGEGTGQAEYVLPDDSGVDDIDDDDRYAAYEMDDPEDEHDEAGQ
jgi:hypothetical protein